MSENQLEKKNRVSFMVSDVYSDDLDIDDEYVKSKIYEINEDIADHKSKIEKLRDLKRSLINNTVGGGD